MSDKTQKSYRRLDKADRVAIENGLDKQKSCRQMANELGRSPSTIADEVSRNRVVCRGAEKGEQVIQIPEDACPKLATWPHCCNGCKYRRYHCTKKWRCDLYRFFGHVALRFACCKSSIIVYIEERTNYGFKQSLHRRVQKRNR